jgi:hypothetical protein
MKKAPGIEFPGGAVESGAVIGRGSLEDFHFFAFFCAYG